VGHQRLQSRFTYDEFVKLQLAADKIEGTNSVNLAALGFLGLGPKYYNRGRIDVMADEWEDRVDTLSRTMLGLTVACARCHDHKFDPITMRDYYALAGVFASTRMINKGPGGKEEKAEKADKMDPDAVHVVEDGEAQNLNVFLRGNVDRKGPVVERRFLRALSSEPVPFKDGSGRKELAQCIATRSNPLTARVMVNRVWGVFFGRPLVITPSNFGHSGQPPSHPELLDDLAVRFMDNGWSIKRLVREIVLSSTYRQSTRTDTRKASIDSNNELLWRMNRRRLSVEQWRDNVLFVSGQLDSTGGKSLELDDPANHRRTVYARVSRLKLNDILTQFDYPDANVHAEKRAVTTTATQKLFMLNSPFMLRQANALSTRVKSETTDGDQARVSRAYRLLFGREPDKEELKLALEFLREPEASEMPRWEQYVQMLLASNEMIYVD
jgi:PAS domain-containing protein